MIRSLKISFRFSNKNKLNQLDDLWLEYKEALENYLDRLFDNKNLSEEYIHSINTKLSSPYRQAAKRQIFKLFKVWCRTKSKSKPKFDNPYINLNQSLFKFRKSKKSSFDYWVYIASLNKYHRIKIPIKSYNYLNKYLENWNLRKGAKLFKKNNQWFLVLCFEKETPKLKENGNNIGVDIGIKKLMVDSNGNYYGKDIEVLIDKIKRKQRNGKAFKRALIERNNYINQKIKELPYNNNKVIVAENINNIHKNIAKNKKIKKEFRSKFHYWTYGNLLKRIELACELHGVHFHKVNPFYTSQICNKCGFVSQANRRSEIFKCIDCGYMADADHNASLNILNSYLAQESKVPVSTQGGI